MISATYIKTQIAREIYAAFKQFEAEEELLVIVGSSRDAVDNAEVLSSSRGDSATDQASQ